MAIVIGFDNSADLGTSSTVSSKTVSYTVGTGLYRLLIVGVTADTTSDLVTGVTYGGVSMTQLAKKQGTAALHWGYVYGLLNPASGANNVVISASANCNSLGGIAASYTGTRQVGLPDATNTAGNTGVTSLTMAVTSILDNCWAAYFVNTATAAITSFTNFTQRRQGTTSDNAFVYALADTNAVIHPPGAQSGTASNAGTSADWGGIMVTFAPSIFVQRRSLTDVGTRTATRQVQK